MNTIQSMLSSHNTLVKASKKYAKNLQKKTNTMFFNKSSKFKSKDLKHGYKNLLFKSKYGINKKNKLQGIIAHTITAKLLFKFYKFNLNSILNKILNK